MKTQIFLTYVIACIFSLGTTGCISQNHLADTTARAPQSDNLNPGVVEINNASQFSKVFVISDVHGMYNQLLAILKAGHVIDAKNNWMAENSLLIVDGDSIDKGPQSLDILDLWIKLQVQSKKAGGNFIHVLGNHEAEFLADPTGDKKAAELLAELSAKNIPVSDLTTSNSPRGLFLHTEPVAAVVGKWLFCHSGFYPDMTWADFKDKSIHVTATEKYDSKFLIGNNSILEAKDWEKDKSTLKPVLERLNTMGLFGIVFGHQPGAFGIKGRSAAKAKGRLIKIDNGIPAEGGSHPGSLLVFTDPSQMNLLAYPQIKIINPDKTSYDLIPE